MKTLVLLNLRFYRSILSLIQNLFSNLSLTGSWTYDKQMEVKEVKKTNNHKNIYIYIIRYVYKTCTKLKYKRKINPIRYSEITFDDILPYPRA